MEEAGTVRWTPMTNKKRRRIPFSYVGNILCLFVLSYSNPAFAHSKGEPVSSQNRILFSSTGPATITEVSLRKFPYPYKSMLALASDTDGMTLNKFILIHRYLNTGNMTPPERGLGLDIADSCFFFIGTDRSDACDSSGTRWQDQMSYFYRLSLSRLRDAAAIITFARAGWIDSLHSLGDFSMHDENSTFYNRRYALAAIKELRANHLDFEIWINHGNRSNVENFGNPETRYQQGDIPHSPYQVTDLMVPHQVRFVWTRRDRDFGLSSMIYPIVLRDGRKVWGFYRYTDDGYTPQGQLLWNWNPRKLSTQLSDPHLRSLEERRQYAIVAQHLGGNATAMPFYGESLTALVHLMHEYRLGHILVARTSRLLRYNVAQQYLHYRVDRKDGRMGIHMLTIADPWLGSYTPTADDLRGITFYARQPGQTDLYINDTRISQTLTKRYAKDSSGYPSIGVDWWPVHTDDVTDRLPRLANHPPHSSHSAPSHLKLLPEKFIWNDDPI